MVTTTMMNPILQASELDDETRITPLVVANNKDIIVAATAAVEAADVNTKANTATVDTLLANELNGLSMQERDLIMNEIHGVGDRIIETPHLISYSLSKLDEVLLSTTVPNVNMEAYWLAHEQNSEYTTNSKFRLSFLRSEKFQIIPTAQRISHYFQQKLILYGKDKLTKTITLTDLSTKDIDALSSGYMQWLSERDTSGRPIYFQPVLLRGSTERSNMLRALWYFLNVMIENDTEIQKNGIVYIAYTMGYNTAQPEEHQRRKPPDKLTAYYMGLLFRSIPIRIEVFHVCCQYTSTLIQIKLALFATSTEIRIRTRTHFGSYLEVFYALMSFGIPVKSIPINAKSEFDFKSHHAWIEYRKQVEERSSLSLVSSSNLKHGTTNHSLSTTTKTPMILESSHHHIKTPSPLEAQHQQPPPITNSPTLAVVTTAVSSIALDTLNGDRKESSTQNINDGGNGRSSMGASSQTAAAAAAAASVATTTTRVSTTSASSSSTSPEGVEVIPQPEDVLLGKLKLARQQIGNDILAKLIAEYRTEYDNCKNKFDKVKISKRIVDHIKSTGGRFLKQTKLKYGKDRRIWNEEASIGWIEAPDAVARDKISHTFRNLRLRSPVSRSTSSITTATTSASTSAVHYAGNDWVRSHAPGTTTTANAETGLGTASRLSCQITPSMQQGGGSLFGNPAFGSCFWQQN